MRIALFITCLADQFAPRVGIACTRVLRHLGHEVVFPEAQTCCGQPMFNAGYEPEARALADRMIGVFDGFPAVVTPSASCCAMVREHFPRLFTHDAAKAAQAADLAARTFEFVEFLSRVLRVDLDSLGLAVNDHVTHHPSCHQRALGTLGQTERLLSQVRGLNISPLDKADQCCGFGGVFSLKFPAISGDLAMDKAACIERTGAAAVVCNDTGCAINIEGACRRRGLPVPVTSTAEIIAEGLGLMEGE